MQVLTKTIFIAIIATIVSSLALLLLLSFFTLLWLLLLLIWKEFILIEESTTSIRFSTAVASSAATASVATSVTTSVASISLAILLKKEYFMLELKKIIQIPRRRASFVLKRRHEFKTKNGINPLVHSISQSC